MKSFYRRFLAALLVIFWLPAGALALTGQNMPTFETYYKDNISYINSNTGRHMLPLTLETLDLSDNGRMQYSTYSDALHVTITADAAGIVETCDIRLLVLEGMVLGNSLYQDFTTAGYHSYAFIMAMHVSAEPSSRYLLVQEISTALKDNFGFYERQLGAYTITCTRVIGEGAVFTFTNNGLAPAQTGEPADEADEQDVPTVIDEDEGANIG
jgi:hypothetical protein